MVIVSLSAYLLYLPTGLDLESSVEVMRDCAILKHSVSCSSGLMGKVVARDKELGEIESFEVLRFNNNKQLYPMSLIDVQVCRNGKYYVEEYTVHVSEVLVGVGPSIPTN